MNVKIILLEEHSVSLIWTFDDVENNAPVYRAKDCMEKILNHQESMRNEHS